MCGGVVVSDASACVWFATCAAMCDAQNNQFEWHFTIRGPPDTPFEGGVYHGRILLPTQYPLKPPNIMFLTVRAARWHSGARRQH